MGREFIYYIVIILSNQPKLIMKHHYSFLLLAFLPLFLNNVNAQINITLAEPQPNLAEVYGGSFASGDIDNDGDD